MLFYLLVKFKTRNTMSKIISFLLLFILFSCTDEKEIDTESEVKKGIGTVWLSGGLYFCAT